MLDVNSGADAATETRPAEPAARVSWAAIIVLASAQFVMVLDSTVMNVSITTVAKDLHTTIEVMQAAITCYTLVMAGLMLVGGKLGDILGRRRAFAIGLVIYGTGSLITGLSQNAAMLLLGWSVIEGMGAVLVIPAIASLAAANYRGRSRAIAYGILGGIAGAAAAAGPLIGGFATEKLSWRLVFISETAIVLVVLLAIRMIGDAKRQRHVGFDAIGAVLSACGLFLGVFGILQSSRWGWVRPLGALEIGGKKITPFGFSVVPFMILAGVLILMLFFHWEERLVGLKRPTLIEPSLLAIPRLRAGLLTLFAQYLALAGCFFVIPVYLQVVLLKNPLQTGIAIVPLSVTLIIAALGGARLSKRISPKRIVQAGLAAMVAGSFALMIAISPDLRTWGFGISLAILGLGIGLLASQLGNVNLSSVDDTKSSEVGGIQGVFQNLGSSVGTALIGSILLFGLTTQFIQGVQGNPAISPKVQQEIVAGTKAGVSIVSEPQLKTIAQQAGLSPSESKAIIDAYTSATQLALKEALLAVSILIALSFWFTRKLPDEPIP
jgi:MFS family permease